MVTAKEYLNKIRELDGEINDKIDDLDDLRAMSTTLGGFQTGERVQSSPNHDKIEKTIIKIVDKENEINDLIDQYVDKKTEAGRMIDRIEDQNERRVLRRRYLRGMKWEDICVDMDYEWAQTHRYHAKALINFNMILNDIE